jgi:hypothetical protein
MEEVGEWHGVRGPDACLVGGGAVRVVVVGVVGLWVGGCAGVGADASAGCSGWASGSDVEDCFDARVEVAGAEAGFAGFRWGAAPALVPCAAALGVAPRGV